MPGRGEEFIGFALPMISEEIKARVRERVATLAPVSRASRGAGSRPYFDLSDERLQLASGFRALEPAELEIIDLRFMTS